MVAGSGRDDDTTNQVAIAGVDEWHSGKLCIGRAHVKLPWPRVQWNLLRNSASVLADICYHN